MSSDIWLGQGAHQVVNADRRHTPVDLAVGHASLAPDVGLSMGLRLAREAAIGQLRHELGDLFQRTGAHLVVQSARVVSRVDR